MEKHVVTAENADLVLGWLDTRGGLAIWGCLDLGGPGKTWTAPLNDEKGERKGKPHWSATSEPVRVINDADEVVVSRDREVKRFRIAIRYAPNRMAYKVSDGGSRRIRKEVGKAGKGAYHVFDYETQEAVIMAPEGVMVGIREFVEGKRKEN
mgnify:CR=1 FL=1